VSVQFFQKQFDTASAKLAIGEATQTELALTKAALYRGISDRAQNESDLETFKATFKQLVGVEPGSLDPAEIAEMPENLNELSNKAKKHNFALLEAKTSLESEKAGVLVQAGELLPSLDARVQTTDTSWTHTGSSSPSTPKGKNFSTSLALKIPIFVKGGAQYSAVRQARNKSRTAALVFDQQIKKLDQQIESTWGSLRANKSAFSAYQMQVEAQSSAVDGMKKQLDVGLVALVDLLEQEQRLVLAQTNAAKSETEYVNAVYTIKYIMGELTAKKLNLNVKHFDPEAEFRKIKLKIVGF
jgi:outer membrane protein